ncbi:MAG: hypothetical protein ACLFOA_09535 [Desulfohalobiaceae bacterium]
MCKRDRNQIGFGKKIYIGALGIVLFTVCIMASINLWQGRKAYFE